MNLTHTMYHTDGSVSNVTAFRLIDNSQFCQFCRFCDDLCIVYMSKVNIDSTFTIVIPDIDHRTLTVLLLRFNYIELDKTYRFEYTPYGFRQFILSGQG